MMTVLYLFLDSIIIALQINDYVSCVASIQF